MGEPNGVLVVSQLEAEGPVGLAITLIAARPADASRPWEAGNEYAESVRERLGWGDEPIPDLEPWLRERGLLVAMDDRGLPRHISLVSERSDDARALIHVNRQGASKGKRETGIATALGHLLMDEAPAAIDGDWEDWPTSARARAFGVALVLPEEGVRQVLSGSRVVGLEEVKGLMRHFRAGPYAVTHRLKNLGFISEEERSDLVGALQSVTARR